MSPGALWSAGFLDIPMERQYRNRMENALRTRETRSRSRAQRRLEAWDARK